MLSYLRPYMGRVKEILAWPYLQANMSATGVGLFGVVMAILAAVSLRCGYFELAFWLALVAVLTDMADGEVARSTHTESPKGNYLDAMGDRLRECFLLFGLLPLAPDLVALALIGTFLTSFAKARCGLVIMMDNRDWPGFGDHADRAVLLLVAYFFAAQATWPLGLLVVATWSCFFVRTRSALNLIKRAAQQELLPYLRSEEPPNDTNEKTEQPNSRT